jgi:LPS export ABC transporter protein LptC
LAIVSSVRFFLGLTVLCILAILFINPKNIEQSDEKRDYQLAFYNFEAMSFSDNGLDTILKSKNSIKYIDYTIFSNPILVKKNDDGKLQMVEAQYAKYSPDDYIIMRGDIYYIRDDGVELKSDSLDYDLKSDKIFSKSIYKLNFKDSVVFGNGFEYDVNKKEMISYDVKANMVNK